MAIVDGLLAYLVALFSEIIFGEHEGLHRVPDAVTAWAISPALCVVAPIAGFFLWGYRKPRIGVAVAALPIAGALLLLALLLLES
ncbi:MAG TPA: hypothetical protein VK432_03340 [Stellaceae bacterium]|nr:hypothetical protein [Stellaceae bacterium]